MAKLTFILDDGQEIVVPLGERVSVGREMGNDVLVDDPRISARHAEITRDGTGVFEVHDLASKLGTFVNGEKVARRFLTTGDRVEFGPLKSVFDLADMIAPSAAAPAGNGASTAESAPPVAKPPEAKSPEPTATKKRKKKAEESPARPARTDTEKVPPTEALIPSPPLAEAAPPPASPPTPAPAPVPAPAATSAPAPIPPEVLAAAVQEALEKMQASEKEAIEKLKARHTEAQKRLDSLNEDLGVISKQRADSIALGAQERKQHQDALDAVAAASAEQQNQHQDALASLTTAIAREQQSLEEFTQARQDAEIRFQEITDSVNATVADLEEKSARLEQLTAEEAQLHHVTAALRETEAQHAQVTQDLENVTQHHAAKHAEWQRVTAAAEGAVRELEAMGVHKENTLAHIQSLVQQTETLDSRVKELHAEVAAKESRSQDIQILAEARQDQIKSAEKKLQQIDAERLRLERLVAEFGVYEEKVKHIRGEHAEAETRHSELKDMLKSLGERHVTAEKHVADLDATIAHLREEHAHCTQAAAAATAARQQVDENLQRIHAERAVHEQTLSETRTTLIAERQRLEEVQSEHRDLTQKCAELADTDSKLEASKAALTQHEQTIVEKHSLIAGLQEDQAAHSKALEDLLGQEEAANHRLETLLGREKQLLDVLTDLDGREREHRERFEEIRKLSAEADQEFEAHKEQIARDTEVARRDLADLEVRLAPLRDWKDAMDKRYARLASLPEDSAEARDLWREIEAEKSNLRGLIPQSAGVGTRSVSLREAVLKNLTRPADDADSGEGNGVPRSPSIPHAPPAPSEDFDSPDERTYLGAGAMVSGTGQEMALKARLNRLRESVQREAMRLEFIRQERSREETRGRHGGPGQSMMREQERQLESKVRREEETLATVQRKIELAEMEEDRRREKIAEMERRLAELKADIAEAERQRSSSRHQVDLVQTELRNHEAALDRVKRLNE